MGNFIRIFFVALWVLSQSVPAVAHSAMAEMPSHGSTASEMVHGEMANVHASHDHGETADAPGKSPDKQHHSKHELCCEATCSVDNGLAELKLSGSKTAKGYSFVLVDPLSGLAIGLPTPPPNTTS